MYLNCPNCSAMWGQEEFDRQSCDACGYPNEDDMEDLSDYEERREEEEIDRVAQCICGAYFFDSKGRFQIAADCVCGR